MLSDGCQERQKDAGTTARCLGLSRRSNHHIDIQFSQHQFLKDTVLTPVDLSWYPCQKSIAYEGMGLFLNSQFYSDLQP